MRRTLRLLVLSVFVAGCGGADPTKPIPADPKSSGTKPGKMGPTPPPPPPPPPGR